VDRVVRIPNLIDGVESGASAGWIPKVSPVTEEVMSEAARSQSVEVDQAVLSAQAAQKGWASATPVARGDVLFAIAERMAARKEEIARTVHEETGKSMKDALGETDGSIKLARFFAGEGQRLFGRTTTSGVPGRTAHIIRQPVGVAGLIAAANTPIANVSWKVFPALICGNAAVFKASEDAPATAHLLGLIAIEAGLPPGALNIIQGLGAEAGQPLAENPRVGVVSFTGSTKVGQKLGEICSRRLAKCSLELGGKNAFVVLNDARLEQAVHWAVLSAFSNAGQRCASASRIIVEEDIYEEFREKFVARAKAQKAGPTNDDDYGPVIHERAMNSILSSVSQAAEKGATVLAGGVRAKGTGWLIEATIIEGASMEDEVSQKELFGPVAVLYRAQNEAHALELANHTDYGLTACVHTRSLDRAWRFTQQVRAGVVSVNGATYGSEPHMPFGGVGMSGNGTREPGPEALDVYSNLKNILIQTEAAP
jgi:alpha-ketoglutaric semialdehyde dehydrogenase